LIDESGRRIFNVGVERHEALPIVVALHDLTVPRPQTINVMADTLKFHGLALEEMSIEHMSVSPIYLFSTTLLWRNGDTSTTAQQLEMRPGDALGLSLSMGSRLLLSDELARYCVTLPEEMTLELYLINDLLKRERIILPEGKKLRLGYSKTPMRDALVKEFKAALQGKAPPFPEEGQEQLKKEYLTFLLGDDFEQYRMEAG
jgi:bifunctional DNase/RNase